MLLRNGLRRLQESGRPRRPGPGAGPATAVRTLTRSACGLLSSPPALESLAAKKERVDRPVLTNEQRLRSGQRGMTRAMLFGVKAFYAQRGALDKTQDDAGGRTSSTSAGSSSARAS